MALQWSDNLSVGVKEIDDEHKELIAKVNDLYTACSQGKGRAEVANTVNFLSEYVIFHFRDEERLQKKISYPYYAAHKAQHDAFIKDFTVLKNKIDKDGASIDMLMRINRVVVEWLIKHIGNSDKAIGEYIRENNLELK